MEALFHGISVFLYRHGILQSTQLFDDVKVLLNFSETSANYRNPRNARKGRKIAPLKKTLVNQEVMAPLPKDFLSLFKSLSFWIL